MLTPSCSRTTETVTQRSACSPEGRQAAAYVDERQSTMTLFPATCVSSAANGSRQTEASGPSPGSVVPMDNRYGGTRSLIRNAPQAAETTSSRAPARRLLPVVSVA